MMVYITSLILTFFYSLSIDITIPLRVNSKLPMYNKWLYFLYLIIGIVAEVIATSSLIYTKEFSRLWPSVGVLVLYIIGLFFLTLSLRTIPVGIAYAIWAGLGIVFVAIFGFILHKQKLDMFAIVGISLILIGVLLINLFSKSIQH